MLEDTICASATSPVNSPLAIIRISGPGTIGAVNSIFSKPEKIQPRTAVYGTIISNKEIIDDVILTFYKSPESFTGEDMAEISCHGNPIIVRKIIILLNNAGIRLAEPGEFSKRSFLNGKIDLTEAEAINHIITARSEWEVSSAVKQMHGSLRDTVNEIKDRIILLKADIESGIDFIDQDIEFVSYDEAIEQIIKIKSLISDLLRRCKLGEKISHGIDIPIVGRPNVGKSSVLNLILNKERAIVSDIPGTTRDLISEMIQLAGLPIHLIDTAGITETDSEIEKIGVELSRKKIESAPVIIFVFDANSGVMETDIEIYNKLNHKKHIILANKIDLVQDKRITDIEKFTKPIYFSAKTGKGFPELEKALSDIISGEFIDYDNFFIADMRIIDILEKASTAADACKEIISQNEPQEIIAFELQSLIDIISAITGEISPDDILNSIFSRFCIGK